MGIFIFWLVPAVGVAMLLRALVRSLTATWCPTAVLSWRNVLLALLRAFPFVFAFTPYLLMKRGLGVLIPASLYLCGAAYERVFGNRTANAEDNQNFEQAATLFVIFWAVLAFIFFVRQSMEIDRKITDDSQA